MKEDGMDEACDLRGGTETDAGFRWGNIMIRERVEDQDILTYLLAYSLHGTESFLRS